MNFTIDNQTLKDLNIFDERADSIFHMFKSTRTVGARERLREMMHKPSSDINELTLRRDAIKYFYDRKLILDIRNEELDLIEFYLKSDKRKSKSNLNIAFSCLDTFFENGKPVFTYKLTEGVSKERLGMFIVLNEGIVEVIRKAAQG